MAAVTALVTGLAACSAVGSPSAVASPGPSTGVASPTSAALPSPAPPVAWPTEGWLTAAPEAAGLDSATLAGGLRELADHGSQLHSLTIVRDGVLVLDAYKYPYDGSIYHDLASVTKSVTTTLVGIAADRGLLDLDAPMVSFFPDRTIVNRTERKDRITVRHLASNTSGLDCRTGDRELTLEQMRASDDWVQFVLELDVTSEPGSSFAYCSPGMHLLSAILSRASGMSALDFAHRYLFEPLGITDASWPADSAGNSHGWGDLALRPADAAKIGLLFLQQGRWDGLQVVSAEWVAAATARQAETHAYKAEDYGYGWWIARPETAPMPFFRADGNGGQRILVVPSLNLVVVTTGGGFSLDEIMPTVLEAATDEWQPLPMNPDALRQLRSAVRALATAPPAQPVPALPATATAISGRTIEFEENAYELRAMTLSFAAGANEASMVLDAMHESPQREIVLGLDGRWRLSRAGRPIAARGTWLDPTTFSMEIDEGPGTASYVLRLVVNGAAARAELVGVAEDVVSVAGTFGE
jgi:CubicO group peptidase (beta-lactamase class C family)